MIAAFQYLKDCYREEGMDLFSIAPEGRTRTNGWKPIRGRSNLEIRRNFLRVRTIKQLNSLLPNVVGAPLLEVFKKKNGQLFFQDGMRSPALGKGLD